MKPPFHVQDVIDSVIASGVLGASEQQLTLLKYLVEQSLDGQAGKVNEYTIALDAFKLSTNFDSAQNSSVRVELHRLRKNLKIYNSSNSKFTLSLPPRSYELKVDLREDELNSDAKTDQALTIPKPLILTLLTLTLLGVAYFTIKSNSASKANYCSEDRPVLLIGDLLPGEGSMAEHSFYKNGLNRQFKRFLEQYKTLFLSSETMSCKKSATPVYKLNIKLLDQPGKPNTSNRTSTIHIDVEDAESGSIVYSHEIIDVAELSDSPLRLAGAAYEIAQQESLIMTHALTQRWGNQDALSQHQCVAIAHDFHNGGGESAWHKALDCLVSSYEAGNYIWEVPAALSTLYLLQVRNAFAHSVDNPLEHLLLTHESAQNLSPFAADVLNMDVRIKSFLKTKINRSEGRKAITKTLEVQPYNPRALSQMSQILGFFYGEWKTSLALLDRLNEIRRNDLAAWNWIEVMNNLLNEDSHSAYEEVSAIDFDGQSWGYLIQWILAKRVGSNQADHYRNLLANQGFDTDNKLVAYVSERGYHASITNKMLGDICAPFEYENQRCTQ